MAESLVTQVQRPDLPVNLDEEDDQDVKREIQVDVSSSDVKQVDDETPKSNTSRYKVLSRMFSRQYTPTQGPAQKGFFNDKPSGGSSKNMKALPAHKEELDGQTSNDRLSVDDSPNSPSLLDVEPMEDDDIEVQLAGLIGRNPTPRKHCLVLDLDETLVHSSFRPVPTCDFILNINMDGVTHKVYVLKRPGVDEFLEEMSKYYELVIFTASLDKYANPLLDLLDPNGYLTGRLYREHCTRRGQMYIKDLDRLGRNMDRTLIIDNSPYSYALHPFHAVPILSWFDDPQDTELIDMIPFLRDLTRSPSVTSCLDASKPWRTSHRKLMTDLEQES